MGIHVLGIRLDDLVHERLGSRHLPFGQKRPGQQGFGLLQVGTVRFAIKMQALVQGFLGRIRLVALQVDFGQGKAQLKACRNRL